MFKNVGIEIQSSHQKNSLLKLHDKVFVLGSSHLLAKTQITWKQTFSLKCPTTNPTPHLIGWNPHGWELHTRSIQQLEALLVIEERTAVGAVIAFHGQAGWPGFGAEAAAVAQAAQHRLEGVVVVVHLLQAQDVRPVGEDLLQDEKLSPGPADGLQGALHKTVQTFAQSFGRTRWDGETGFKIGFYQVLTMFNGWSQGCTDTTLFLQ